MAKEGRARKVAQDMAQGQKDFFEKSYAEEMEERSKRPVECLGLKFENDDARRKHFLDKLATKLKESAFRKTVGFPIGKDEDILALSDPPYYTACPNPFLAEFAKHFGKPYDPAHEKYRREPFAADVSEGKNDPIYNAHSYHTKVPHKAIMRYILHYTEPGDLVFDGFCGTGMAGVAAQLCGNKEAVKELGYTLGKHGEIQDSAGIAFSKIGSRAAMLNDLSPAATLIAAGYNLTTYPAGCAAAAAKLLKDFESKYGWMYETVDPKTKKTCPINYTAWSEMFSCGECSKEIEFWSLAYDEESGKVAGTSKCPHCGAEITKRDMVRKTTSFYDPAMKKTRKRQVLTPVLINYECGGQTKEKKPDKADLDVLRRIEEMLKDLDYPTELMMFTPEGEEWGDLYRGYHEGISRVHDFHLPRQLATASLLWSLGTNLDNAEQRRLWRFLVQSILVSFTRRNRFRMQAYSQVNTNLSGTLYIGSTVSEPSPRYVLGGKIKRFTNAIPRAAGPVGITTQSLVSTAIPSSSVDYVFLDPPFGDNLPYSELNFLWEAWLRVFTNAKHDAVVSGTQDKDVATYTLLMADCLTEVYRILKPGRWITVEFHNSKNAIWTSIQEALGRAGFIIADVRVLDKGMLTKKQLNANAVNKDLVISAYKPNSGLEDRFKLEAGELDGVWDFIRTHLRQLPVFVADNEQAEIIVERQNFLLFDRMVAFHVQRGVTVPLSASEFYDGLAQRFPVRDGMHFLQDQVALYDRKRGAVQKVQQLELFVTDEASAIQWLRIALQEKPQTFKEIQPQFIKQIGGWEKHEKSLELRLLLEQNFLFYDGEGEVPSQIHAYLSTNFKELRKLKKDDPALRDKAKDRWYVADPKKSGDLEKLRERDLMREFWEYLPPGYKPAAGPANQADLPGLTISAKVPKGVRMKVIRMEAVRTGFRHCWQNRDYRTIVAVARRIPEDVLQEDAKLLMWYDQAVTRLGEE